MNRVGKFEKVSFKQFENDIKLIFDPDTTTDNLLKEIFDDTELPRRATSGSAGFDIHTPIGFTLEPGECIVIPSGVRVKINDGWFLAVFPRSGLGFKYKVQLANTVGIIDSDYYFSENEGHIMLKIVNNGARSLSVLANDKIAQGIFLEYGITEDDDVTDIRNGGFGSTGN